MLITLQSITALTINSPLIFWLAPIAGVIAVISSLLLMRKIGKMSPAVQKPLK